MRPLITSFQQEYLWPICRRLYPLQASQFDDHHAFIVRYRGDEDLGLDMHIDNSDLTLIYLLIILVCIGLSAFFSSSETALNLVMWPKAVWFATRLLLQKKKSHEKVC